MSCARAPAPLQGIYPSILVRDRKLSRGLLAAGMQTETGQDAMIYCRDDSGPLWKRKGSKDGVKREKGLIWAIMWRQGLAGLTGKGKLPASAFKLACSFLPSRQLFFSNINVPYDFQDLQGALSFVLRKESQLWIPYRLM